MIDFGTLISQLLSSFWWVLPLFALAALFKSPWFKGVTGKAMVNLAARLFLSKNDYHLIKTSPFRPRMALPRLIISSFPASACLWSRPKI